MGIRVLLADDQALVRAGFRALLERAEDIEVVGEAGDGARALDAVRRYRPDVVLMDIRMPGLVLVIVFGVVVAAIGGVELTAYRIVQEALTNVLRHANARTVTVEVRRVDGALRVGPPTEGLGLTGMRERAHALGGTFRAGPDTDNGFRITASLPL